MINRHLQKTVGSSSVCISSPNEIITPVISLWGDGIITRRGSSFRGFISHDLRFEIIDRRKPRWNETEWDIGQWPFKGGEGGWVYRVAIRLVAASPNRLIRSQRFTNAKTVRPRYKPSKYRYSTTVIGSGRAIINSRTRHDREIPHPSKTTLFAVSCVFNFRFSRRYASRDLDPLVSHLFKKYLNARLSLPYCFLDL